MRTLDEQVSWLDDEEEDHRRDQTKRDNRIQQVTVGKYTLVDLERQILEGGIAANRGDQRRQQVLDKRRNNILERRAHHHRDREIDDVSPKDELLKRAQRTLDILHSLYSFLSLIGPSVPKRVQLCPVHTIIPGRSQTGNLARVMP